jgi:NTP pyrophosphatase (non-canonical NTP hydrolase)
MCCLIAAHTSPHITRGRMSTNNIEKFEQFVIENRENGKLNKTPRIISDTLELSKKSGELSQIANKFIHDDKLNYDEYVNKLGDILASIVLLADEMEVSIEDIAELSLETMVTAKVQRNYVRGRIQGALSNLINKS